MRASAAAIRGLIECTLALHAQDHDLVLAIVDLYGVFCAVLYLLKSGCQWRMLPGENPKWRTVHSYFAQGSEPGPDGISVLERALKKSGWRGLHRTGAQRHDEFLDG